MFLKDLVLRRLKRMIVMILLYVMTMLIKLSRELSVPFSEGYDRSLTNVKDTPQVKRRKKEEEETRFM